MSDPRRDWYASQAVYWADVTRDRIENALAVRHDTAAFGSARLAAHFGRLALEQSMLVTVWKIGQPEPLDYWETPRGG